MNNSTNDNNHAPAPKTILVHKKDSEDALTLDALTGLVITDLAERPEWSEGLTVAMLVERQGFYASRLGPDFAKAHAFPDVMAFEDLSWLAADAEGEPVELEADAEHRMTVIGEALGINRDADLSHGKQDNTHGELAHVLLDTGTEYSTEEVSALDKAQLEGFEIIRAKDGTNGH